MPRHGKKSGKTAASKEKEAREVERKEKLLAKRKIEDTAKERQDLIRDVCKNAMFGDDGRSVRNGLDLATAFTTYKAASASEPPKWGDRTDLLPAEDSDDKRIVFDTEAEATAGASVATGSDAVQTPTVATEKQAVAGAGADSSAIKPSGKTDAAVDPLLLRRDTIVEADGYAGIGQKSDAWMRDEDEDEYNASAGAPFEVEIVHRHGGVGDGAATTRERDWMLSLTKRNLMNLYIRARWGWSDGEKRTELTDPDARYLIAYRKGQEASGDNRPLGFVHYRFIA